MSRRQGLNLQPFAYKATAPPVVLRRRAPSQGFEPRYRASKTRVLPLDEPGIELAGAEGFEPSLAASETAVLPVRRRPKYLNCEIHVSIFTRALAAGLEARCLASWLHPRDTAAGDRTQAGELKAHCSTLELRRREWTERRAFESLHDRLRVDGDGWGEDRTHRAPKDGGFTAR